MTAYSKKMPKTPSKDPERETRVLLEDVRTELQVVAEGHTSIVKRLDKVEGDLQEVKEDIKGVKVDLQVVKGQLGQLQNQVGSVLTDHEHRLTVVEKKFP